MPSPDRLRAQAIGYLVHPWRPARGVVHSVYDSAVNLVVEEALYTVLPDRSPDGPTTVRVHDAGFPRLTSVRRGDPVAMRAATLRVGAIPIDLRTATVWRPSTSPAPAAPGVGRRAHELACGALQRGGAAWIPEVASRAVTAGDPSEHVWTMLGNGVGLTPAGDDGLVGVLAGAWYAGDRPVHRRIAAAIGPNVHRTTDLSAAFLRQATAGHFQQPVLEAATVVLTGGMRTADLRLLSVGATSGADCALGLATVIDILTRRTSKVAA